MVREAKAEAARQGRTIASLTCLALELALKGEPRAPTGLEADRAWYEKHFKRLVDRYEGQFVAIIKGAVVDHDDDFAMLAERVFAKHGPRPIFMPRVVRAPRVARVRSPRVVAT